VLGSAEELAGVRRTNRCHSLISCGHSSND
jgi:hypothetical protein